jgi:hypothetical protein
VLTKAGILAAVAFAPAVVAWLVAGLPAAIGVGLGLALGLSAGLLVPPRLSVVIVGLNLVAAAAGLLVIGSPVGAAVLVGVAGLALGPANRRGVGRAMLLLPLLVTLSATGLLADDPVRSLGGMAVGAAWAIAITARLGARRELVALGVREAWTHAVALAATTSIATFVALSVPLPHGYWIVVTLCAVLVPTSAERARATTERVAGTISGALLGIVVGVLLPTALTAVAALGALVLMVAYALVGDGRRKVLWLTVLLVLMLGGAAAGSSAVDVALQRLAWTVVGAVLVGAAAVLVASLDRHALAPDRAAA